jgi:hypothetical protein
MTRLFGLFLLAVAFLAPGAANAAACFWVGGTGSINDTTHWASATGGTASTCAAAGGWPNSVSDTATFDASSGGGTITRNVSWTIGTLNIAAFTGTFGNSTDSAAVQVDSFTSNGSGTRTFNMGSSTWTCGRNGVAKCSWLIAGETNQTFAANTSTLILSGSTGAGQAQTAWLSNRTYNVVTMLSEPSPSTGTDWNGAATIGTFNIGAGQYISLRSFLTITTWNQTGTPSFSALTTITSNGFNTNQSLTLTNPGTCSYCAFSDVSAPSAGITAANSFILHGTATGISVTNPSTPGGGGGRIIGG